ncbi:MAG: RNA methyltransferase [Muribaculaceae bacterium]|nr:RNA methyltransferase [Muribaculaceae bacterium]
MTEKFEMVAKTFQGLEGVLADELRALGADNVLEGVRMVSFEGDKELLYRANFGLRTALRILKPFYKFRSTDADDLYEQVKRYDWSTVMKVNQTFAIDSTTNGEEFRHSRFVTYRVKDAIADYFMDREGRRPSIRVTNPDIRLDVHINGDQVTLSLDSSGEPLYKRGWRVGQTEAPINEVLAAGIIKLSGWDGQCDLVDPLCGSGTFLVEAALMALNINPGVFRQEYAFQKWDDYDADLFDEIYNDDSGEREFNHKIYGSDIDGKAIAVSRANAKSAGVMKYIELERRDLAEIEQVPEQGFLITNPPYDQRLRLEDAEAFYSMLGSKLKHVFRGYHAWIIGYNREHYDKIGLRASVHYPLLNGSLECELREYVIFDGKYDEMRSRGESIRNEDFHGSEDRRKLVRREFKETFSGDKDGKRPQHRREGDRPRFKRDDREHREGDRPRFKREGDRPRRSEGDRRPPRFTPGQGPTLGADKEVPIIHGRRKSWKRRDLPEDNE